MKLYPPYLVEDMAIIAYTAQSVPNTRGQMPCPSGAMKDWERMARNNLRAT